MNFLQTAIPGETIRLYDFKLTCSVCHITSELEAYGYALPQTDEDIKVGRVRVVLRKVFGNTSLKCDCLLPSLHKMPIVAIFTPADSPKFN